MLHNLSQPADSNKTNYIVETNQSFHVLVFSETPSALAKLYTGLDSGSELELTFSPTSNDDLPNHLQTAQLDEYNALLIDLSTFDISTLATIDFHNLDIPSIALLKENDLQQEAELFAIGINDCILFSELSSLHHTIFKNVQRSQLYSQQKEQKKSSKTTINLTNDNTDNVVDIQQTFLNKNTEFLNQLIDLNPNLIFVKNIKSQYVFVNQAIANEYGLPKHEIIGKNDIQLRKHLGNKAALHYMRQDKEVIAQVTISNKHLQSFPEETVSYNKKPPRIFTTIKHVLFDKQGEPSYILGNSIDITTLIKQDTELKETKAIIESSPIIINKWTAPDTETIYLTHVSNNIQQFGYTAEELKRDPSKWVRDICHPEDIDSIKLSLLKAVMNGSNTATGEYRIYTKQGDIRWIEFQINIERNQKGIAKYFQGFFFEITNRKRNEQELFQALQEEERKSNELMLIGRIQSTIADKLALEQIFETAVKTIAEVLDYRAISLGYVQGDRIYLHPLHSHGYEDFLQEGYSVSLNEGIQGLAARTLSPVLVPDVHKNPNYNPVLSDIVSNIAIPVFSKNKIMAVLIVEHSATLDQTDLSLLIKITEQLAIAIENATLHEQALKDLHHSEARYEITQLLLSTENVEESLQEIITIIAEALSAQWATLENYDVLTDTLSLGHSYINSKCIDIQIQNVLNTTDSLAGTLSHWAAKNKKPTISKQNIHETRIDQSVKEVRKTSSLGSTMVVPIFNNFEKETVTGVLSILRMEEEDIFSESELKFLQSIVQQISMARAQHQLSKHIEFQAFNDDLTGLPNRRLFERSLVKGIEQAKTTETQVGLLFLDLDGFKHINDTLGHDVGDRLLQLVSKRLQNQTRETDMLVRMGGDEFTLILHDINSRNNALSVAKRYLETLDRPFSLEGHEVKITASIGLSIFPEDGHDASTLLKHADIAMYLAKQEGRNGIQSFSEELGTKARERLLLENSLRLAVERKEFILHYQPQYSLDSGELRGVEALIRWHHPIDGLIPPIKFISIAEETLLIIAMGEWALNEACRQAAIWHNMGHPIMMSVNVAAPQFTRNNFIDTVKQALETNSLEAKYLELEVTEGVVMHNVDVVAVRLQELRDLGVSIALDDFGTGFSSLQYLQKLPFDKLKVDRSFIKDIGEVEDDSQDKKLMKNILQLAASFELKVVAEGIETKLQGEFLKELGCDYVQGFYYAKPLTAENLFKDDK